MDKQISSTNRILSLARTVLELLIQWVVFVAFAGLVVLGIVAKPAEYLTYVLMIIVPVTVMYLARKYVKRFSLFVFIHIVMLVLAFALGNTEAEITAYVICVAFAMVRSISLKLALIRKSEFANTAAYNAETSEISREERDATLLATERMNVLYCVVMVIGYFFGNGVKSQCLMELEVICFIIFVLLQVASNQIGGINEMFLANEGKSEFPASRIININAIMVVVVSLLMIMGMILFYNGKYGNVFSIIGSGLFALVSVVVKLFLMLIRDDGEEITMPQGTNNSQEDDGGYLSGSVEESSDNPLMNALFEAFAVVVILSVVIAIIVAVLRYAKRFRNAREEDIDEVEFIGKDAKEERLKRRQQKMHEKDLPVNAQYRKLFKKKVLAHRSEDGKKKAPKDGLQPEDITRQCITNDEESAKRITVAYEKARYSNEIIERDELDFLKNTRN